MKRENIDKLVTEALAIEAETAAEAGALGYMARAMVQATMPHRKTPGNEFTRTNGYFTLSMLSPSSVGLPYGALPRLLVAWVTTEAVRTKSAEIELGPSLSSFMEQLGLTPTGGRWGSITRLRSQMKRLFTCSVSCIYQDGQRDDIMNVQLVEKARLWWDPKRPEQAALWRSTLMLGRLFFEEALNNPVPVDMRALKALKRSALALDIYCWLTYRMFYLKKQTEVPWAALKLQFGASYTRERDFRRYFLSQLKAVQLVYPELKLEIGEVGLILKPSKPHVGSRGGRFIPHD